MRYEYPLDFIERHFYIKETLRPLNIHEGEWADVIDAMNERDEHGDFMYSTWVLSAPKKSGKTTWGASLVLWMGWRVPNARCYVIGNDLQQARSRMFEAIEFAVKNDPRQKDVVRVAGNSIYLPNGSIIEALPVDPYGEAGMNPTVLAYTEVWGARHKKHEAMWTEAQLSPTQTGQSFKIVESYAGFRGDCPILEPLFDSNVKPEYLDADIPELYRNGGTVVFWCTRPTMPWQIGNVKYYAEQRKELTDTEFDRIHGNKWSDTTEKFVPIEWWKACYGDIPPMGQYESAIMALDAAVSDDCFACVVISRIVSHYEEDVDGHEYPIYIFVVRFCRIWYPPPGGKLDYDEIQTEIEEATARFPIAQVTYDEFQLHQMAGNLRKKLGLWVEEFPQGAARLTADKGLYDLIKQRRIRHDGNPELTAHIDNADRKEDPESRKLRIVKRRKELKIDAAVAVSMGCDRAGDLDLDG